MSRYTRRARHASTAEKIAASLDGFARLTIVIAAVLLALMAGFAFGASLPPADTTPPVIRVITQPEPQVTDGKAQADAEIDAYNRGMDAGKYLACNVSDIERKTR